MATRMKAERPAKAKAPTEDLVLQAPIQDEDEQLATTIGSQLVEFVRGLSTFFSRAKVLEQEALAELAIVEKLQLPKTEEEDLAIQRLVKKNNAAKTEIEAHWKITAAVSQFHRRMTARRAKATDAREKIASIGNQLHNTYVANERRRAQAEQERINREAQERAEEEHRMELLRLEEEAIKREEQSAMLSDRERLFVQNYCTPGYALGDGTRAAKAAGYKDPLPQAARLLSNRKIQKAIEDFREARELRRQAEQKKLEVVIPQEREVEIRPNVSKAAGVTDRTLRSAELLDENALITAILAGKHGIPSDMLRIHVPTLNAYARDLGERINLWPGVRLKKDTKIV